MRFSRGYALQQQQQRKQMCKRTMGKAREMQTDSQQIA